MPYFRVDDGMWGHPKFEDTSDAAIALWTKAGSWCARYLTDGVLPAARVGKLGSTPAAAAELVRLGLWHATPSGFVFHQWATHQGWTKDDIEQKRAVDAARKRASRGLTKLQEKSEMSARTGAGRPGGVLERRGEENSLSVSSLPPEPQTRVRADDGPTLVVVRPQPLRAELPEQPDNFPRKVGTSFQNLFMARYKLDPNMGGKSTITFPSQLQNTARMRSVDPFELLSSCFERWVGRKPPPTDRERKFQREFPYAAFVGAFGGLVEALGNPDAHWPGFTLEAPRGDRYASSKPFVPVEAPTGPSIGADELSRQAGELLQRLRSEPKGALK